ncbi:MAG: ABC transporter ATP-binding protein [Acidimicrobiales bacterium]|jgi:ABC-type Fe3+/spermidine/putrescine transport system ATPase subunit
MTRTRLEIDISVERRSFDVSAKLSIEPEERIALFGPSGAGKTTLLEAIAGLVDPSSGTVRLGGDTLSRPPVPAGKIGRLGRRMGGLAAPTPAAVAHASLVRQPTALFPHLDVEANVAYGNPAPGAVGDVMEWLGLGALRRARPGSLSGGQVQRVSLARALSRRFSVLLLDEPMSGIDAATRSICWSLIEARCAEEGAVSLLVTHDLREAQAFGHRMAVMDEGELLQVGDPHHVVAAPVSRRAAEVVGYAAFLRMRRAAGGTGASVPDEPELAIDPGRVRLGALPGEGVVLRGTVTACRPAGSGYELVLTVREGTPLDVALGGEWATAVTCDLTMLVDTAVTEGAEIEATALTPPVVASHTSGPGAIGGSSSGSHQTTH